MVPHVTGQSTASTVTAHLSAQRRALLDLLAEATHVVTDAEYDTAVQRILACESLPTLQRWYRNCIREIARREEAQPVVTYATAAQTAEAHKLALHRAITKPERTKALLALPTLDGPKATALIGELWARILHRTGEDVGSTARREKLSYSSAA